MRERNSGEPTATVPSDILDLSTEGEESLVYLAGYVVSKITKRLNCEHCKASLASSAASCRLIQMKNFSTSHLLLTSHYAGVIEVTKVAENVFCASKKALPSNQVRLFEVEAMILQSVRVQTFNPSCHTILPEVVRVFLRVQMQI